jgi:amidophosphoribosyltransferase
LVAHIYDVTYGVVKPQDNLVIIDDSIVRGTTLKKSILKMMDRLNPKQIVIVSSAPQIRYPDCYGIDMARLEGLIAFQAAKALHSDRGSEDIIEKIYQKCKAQVGVADKEQINHVKELYAPFTDEEISDKIAELISEDSITAKVKVIFQSVDDLHKACPKDLGDWYFTGDYPTPGGNRVVNKAYINYYEGNPERAY